MTSPAPIVRCSPPTRTIPEPPVKMNVSSVACACSLLDSSGRIVHSVLFHGGTTTPSQGYRGRTSQLFLRMSSSSSAVRAYMRVSSLFRPPSPEGEDPLQDVLVEGAGWDVERSLEGGESGSGQHRVGRPGLGVGQTTPGPLG